MPALIGRIILAFVSLFFPANVAKAVSGFDYYNNGRGITISGYIGSHAGTLVIPDLINGLPVTEIQDGAFQNSWGDNDLLTKVVIPDTVARIGNNAFFFCHGITEIDLPESLTQLGSGAFSFTGLTSVFIPQKVTMIGSNAFSECRNQMAINVHSANASYSSIDGVLFNKSLTNLIRHPQAKGGACSIPPSVTTIATGAFASATFLTAVTIPSGVTTIGADAFSSCSRLTVVAIPVTVTNIGSGAFGGCLGLAAIDVDAANPAYSSADGVLFNNAQTTLIQCPAGRGGAFAIPPGCITIGDNAFAGCDALGAVTIPFGVSTIGTRAFENCVSLGSADLPASVTLIGDRAFSGCSSLLEMEIPTGIISIRPYTFLRCASLTGIVIPDTVTSIQSDAFSGCVSLVEVVIPPGVTTIGSSTFSGCISLTAVTLPNGLASLGQYAFSGCNSLHSISIPTSVTTIGSSAFTSCSQLMGIHVDANNPSFSSLDGVLFDKTQTSLIQFPSGRTGAYGIPAGVTSIGISAFANCRLLTHVAMGGDVASIGSSAFTNCTGLSEITLGPGVTSIAIASFAGCAGLGHVTIGSNVTSIGESVFSGCDNLAGIEVDAANASFSSLGGVLYNKTQTTLIQCPGGRADPVTISSAVTTIQTDAFSSSRNLAGIYVEPANTAFSSIDGILFDKTQTTLISCPMGKSGVVQIPAGVTNIYYSAFAGCRNLTEFQVDAANPAYRSLDGLLYNKAGTTLLNCPYAKSGTVTLSAIVTSISGALGGCRFLTGIHVDPGNPMFASVDGLLFNKSLSLLIQYPGGKQDYAIIPASVISLGQGAFGSDVALAGLVFLGNAPSSIFFSFDTSVPIQHFVGGIGFSPSKWDWRTVLNMGEESPIKLWLLENDFPFDMNVTTDMNGDGVSLLMAYALNLNPRSNLASGMPLPELDGTFLALTFYAASPGITYRVETSDDLGAWTSDGISISPPDTAGFRTASVPATDTERFMRLVVSE